MALAAAVSGALFVIPYRRATDLGGSGAASLALMSCAAVQTTLIALGREQVQRRGVQLPWAQPHSHALGVRPPARLGFALGVAASLAVTSSVGNLLSAHGLSQVPPAIHSVVLRSELLFVGFLGWLTLGERPSWRFLLGTVLALGGLGILSLWGTDAALSAGVAWGTLAGACFAAMQVILRKTIHRVDPVATNAWRLWMSSLLLAAIPGSLAIALNQSSWFWVYSFCAALAGPTVSRLFTMSATRHLPAAFGPLISLLAPVLVFPLAFVLYGTWPNLQQWVGASVMLLGIALPVFETLRESKRQAI